MLLGFVWNITALILIVYFTGRYARDPEFQRCTSPVYEPVNLAAAKWMRKYPDEQTVPLDIQKNGYTVNQCRLCNRSRFRHIFYNA